MLSLEPHANTSHETKQTFLIIIIMFIEVKQSDPLWAQVLAISHISVIFNLLRRLFSRNCAQASPNQIQG